MDVLDREMIYVPCETSQDSITLLRRMHNLRLMNCLISSFNNFRQHVTKTTESEITDEGGTTPLFSHKISIFGITFDFENYFI